MRKSGPYALLVALLLSSWACFRPGILMSDTMTRWAGAYTLAGKLDIWWGVEQWLAPTMTWFMLPIAAFGLGAGYFLVAQVAYLMTAGAMWIRMTSSHSAWWIPLTFAIPLVFVYSSFVVPDVWTLAAIVVTVGCFHAMSSGARLWPAALLFFSSVVLFGFRQNSLVLVPLVLGFIFTQPEAGRLFKAGLAGLIAAALVVIAMVPAAIGFKGPTSAAAAPAWELIGAIRVAIENRNHTDETLSLDGIVDTQKAVEMHSFGTIDTVLWGADAALPTTAVMKHGDEIKRRWMAMVVRHPWIYLQTKLRIYECMVGLCTEYLQTQVGAPEPWPQLKGNVWGYKAEGPSATLLGWANWTGKVLRWMVLPLFWLPTSALVFAFSWTGYGRHDRMLIAMACGYLLSFFILNQAASFRYLFPTYVVFSAYQIRAIGALVSYLVTTRRRPFPPEPEAPTS